MADVVSKGADAERLLNDPAFKRAIESTENDIVNALCQITLTGSAACMNLVLEKTRELQANRRLKRKLAEFAGSGKVAERQLEIVANKPKRIHDPRWADERS